MKYKDLFSEIKRLLDSTKKFKKVYLSPAEYSGEEGSPVAIFFPTKVANEFYSTDEDDTTKGFAIYIYILKNNITTEKLWSEVGSSLADSVLETFRKGWDFGTNQGNRTRAIIQNGGWGWSSDKSALIIEFNLIIKDISKI